MDITALLSQSAPKAGGAKQPASDGGDAFASSLQAATGKLLSASSPSDTDGEATLTVLNQGVTGEASDALRNALEALTGNGLATIGVTANGTGDADQAANRRAAETADTQLPTDTIGETAQTVAGLTLVTPLTQTTGDPSRAADLPVVRVPDTLNRTAATSGWPADGAANKTTALTANASVDGNAASPTPAWAVPVQETSAVLDKSRLDGALPGAGNQDGTGQTAGVMGATGTGNATGAPVGATAHNTSLFTLQAPVASAPWNQQLGQQMVGLAQRGDQHMELHLNPRELGPLSVSLKLDDQGAQAHFFSSHATVRGAVEQAIPQLREALAEQGIALGEAMVGEQRQGFAGNGDGQPGERGGSSNGGDTLAADSGTASGESVPVNRVISDGSGVDLYA